MTKYNLSLPTQIILINNNKSNNQNSTRTSHRKASSRISLRDKLPGTLFLSSLLARLFAAVVVVGIASIVKEQGRVTNGRALRRVSTKEDVARKEVVGKTFSVLILLLTEL
ncbi:uncharacterized protein BDV14DRAFT_118554 [Aspergillus stella-maris]|uniref:uncharacterized protein n=1 Tax=Aspergillus stella-maris TaxID=1810926 RepID=UPI003CCD8A5C